MPSPNPRDTAMTALAMPVMAPSSAFSCLRMLRISAELSEDTSVAVRTYPRVSSKSK